MSTPKNPADDPEILKVTDLGVFLTREAANEGILVPLQTKTGEQTDKWLRVRGMDSDAFREAQSNVFRALAAIEAIEDAKEKSEALARHKLKAIASLVLGWNLDLEFNEKNLLWFLKEAPQIADQVDRVATRRALFFRARPWSLNSGPDATSGSSSARPEQPSRGD